MAETFNSQRTPQFIIGNKHLHKKDLHALNEYIKEVVQKVNDEEVHQF